MPATIDFIFDFGSPNAYLAWRVLPQIAARTGAAVNLIPALLGGMRVEIGDDVIDGTVASRLDDARRRLAG